MSEQFLNGTSAQRRLFNAHAELQTNGRTDGRHHYVNSRSYRVVRSAKNGAICATSTINNCMLILPFVIRWRKQLQRCRHSCSAVFSAAAELSSQVSTLLRRLPLQCKYICGKLYNEIIDVGYIARTVFIFEIV